MKKTGASFARGNSNQSYATPPDFMSAVEKRFGPIAFDLAASPHNTKHANYFSERDNSLVQEWHKIPGNLWLNPPFDCITPWAQKCAAESILGATIFFLVPASVGSNWFRDYCHGHALVLALNGRVSFDGVAPYPKDLILCCYSLGSHWKGFDTWTWRAPTVQRHGLTPTSGER